MIEFFNSVGAFFQSIGELIVNLVSSLMELFVWVGKALEIVASITKYIPPSLAAIALVFITISVVYLIVGR